MAGRIRQAAWGRPLPYSFHAQQFSPRGSRRGAEQDPTLWAVHHLFAVQTYTGAVMAAEVASALRTPGWHVDFEHRSPPQG